MSLPRNTSLLGHARTLRKEMTKEERHLWYDFLRVYPKKIYKQKIIGPFIVDFYCHDARLIIELDGSQHYQGDGPERESRRTQELEKLGLRVIRFSNLEVTENFDGVCAAIDLAIRGESDVSPLSQLR